MTTKAKKFCLSFPCSATAEKGSAYCPEHRPARAPKETDPFYLSVRWRRFRDWYLRCHPLCEACEREKRGPVPARMVHHVTSLEDGGAKTSDDNAIALCYKCHGVKTASQRTTLGNGTKHE